MSETSDEYSVKSVAEKSCTRCHATKPLTEFTRDTRVKDGRHSWCNTCRNEVRRIRNGSQHPIHGRNVKCPVCGKSRNVVCRALTHDFKCHNPRCFGYVFTRDAVEVNVWDS